MPTVPVTGPTVMQNSHDVTHESDEIRQEAQLPQRDSASATHVFLGSLTDRALH